MNKFKINKSKFKISKNTFKMIGRVSLIACVLLTNSQIVFAASGTEQLDSLIKWIAEWTTKIGLVVAFFGGIQTALGFKNDDADAKVRGLKTLASGFMVSAISKSLELFGL